MRKNTLSTGRIVTISILLVVGIALYATYGGVLSGNIFGRSKLTGNNSTQTSGIQSAQTTTDLSTEQKNHIIDLHNEERLAHDVYVYLYEKRGIKKFGNILQSEIQHYILVEDILNTYKIPYDKNMAAGVYSTAGYTELYNTLIQKGSLSSSDAIAVGVQIETMDIADIQKLYPEFQSYSDIANMLQRLEQGSKNHLAAFSR